MAFFGSLHLNLNVLNKYSFSRRLVGYFFRTFSQLFRYKVELSHVLYNQTSSPREVVGLQKRLNAALTKVNSEKKPFLLTLSR